VRGRGCVDEQVAPWIGLGCYSMRYSTPSEQFDSFGLIYRIPDRPGDRLSGFGSCCSREDVTTRSNTHKDTYPQIMLAPVDAYIDSSTDASIPRR
jgi:hypothetical protein